VAIEYKTFSGSVVAKSHEDDSLNKQVEFEYSAGLLQLRGLEPEEAEGVLKHLRHSLMPLRKQDELE
jgi:hypothetical protein